MSIYSSYIDLPKYTLGSHITYIQTPELSAQNGSFTESGVIVGFKKREQPCKCGACVWHYTIKADSLIEVAECEVWDVVNVSTVKGPNFRVGQRSEDLILEID